MKDWEGYCLVAVAHCPTVLFYGKPRWGRVIDRAVWGNGMAGLAQHLEMDDAIVFQPPISRDQANIDKFLRVIVVERAYIPHCKRSMTPMSVAWIGISDATPEYSMRSLLPHEAEFLATLPDIYKQIVTEMTLTTVSPVRVVRVTNNCTRRKNQT